jgi:hypothetical protein
MRHIIPISGKDSLATAIVQMRRAPDLPYEFVYNDTEAELPETYAWIARVESTLGIKIHRKGKSLEAVIDEQGMLPSQRARFCTKYSKIFPMESWIGSESAMIYFGIRADEDRGGYKGKEHIQPVYPLKEEGIDLRGVYALVEAINLMPPTFFWERVYSDVIKTHYGAVSDLPRWQFDRTFAGRSRPNCFFCFYQRRYEWAWLLEYHPALFDRAEALENKYGSGGRHAASFFWISSDMPLQRIRERFDELVSKRVASICRMLNQMFQSDLFIEATEDGMAQTSCGLMCGK